MNLKRAPRPLVIVVCLAMSATLAAAQSSAATPISQTGAKWDERPPLTSRSGDAQRGRLLFVDRQSGHCVLCHRVSALEAPSQGTIGPVLDTVGSRLTEGQLRLRIMDSTLINPNSAMPAYFKSEGLHQVASAYRGRTVLSAQEVEDVVAYLRSLRDTPERAISP